MGVGHSVGYVVCGGRGCGGTVGDDMDVGVDGIETAGGLSFGGVGVVGVRMEGCTVVEEHGRVPEGVVQGFMGV